MGHCVVKRSQDMGTSVIGNLLTKLLIVIYIIIALDNLYHQDWPKSLYWIGAGLLTLGVLYMK